MVQTPHIESPSAEAKRLHFRFSRGAGAGLPLDFSVQGGGEESCLLGTCARGLSQSRPGHPLACPGLQEPQPPWAELGPLHGTLGLATSPVLPHRNHTSRGFLSPQPVLTSALVFPGPLSPRGGVGGSALIPG